MRNFEIWCEGYIIQGNRDGASLLGTAAGETFKDAAISLFRSNGDSRCDFIADSMTYWGCRLFDNEIDARKNFG